MTPRGCFKTPSPFGWWRIICNTLAITPIFQSSAFAVPHPIRPGLNRRSAENFDRWWCLKFWAGTNLFAWIRLRINRRWHAYFEHYGYQREV